MWNVPLSSPKSPLFALGDVNNALDRQYIVVDDFWPKVDWNQLNQTAGGDDVTAQYDLRPDTIGSRAKVFHPQPAYHQAIYEAIVNQYLADTSPAPVSPPPYQPGTCCFHLEEWKDCNPESNDLYTNIILLDNSKNVIYRTPASYFDNNGLGDPINEANGTTVQDPLPYSLAITREHENDYIQFIYGDLSWQSKSTNGEAQCIVGGWNPRDGPVPGWGV
ncbi:uncharacterized protein TRUGW13939_02319 [Talaromyces rugulosus]|uniref:Uncharacterized protein n=1 Tax=Talaromyces rugulosus TaxID=121627 RepID=A0A7H8QMR1_TALRU|nr:uncharacterized protein TRUGW13939_02319 [Talaromyces rugulosus]QKX55227.1 hypothetical protein TRUGW13939_02319 [Talaromyces rugulosus]